MSGEVKLTEHVRNLENEIERLTKVNQTLMNRVEQSTDAAGSSYSLFESNLLLQTKVAERTGKLIEVNRDLQKEIAEHKATEDALRFERNFVNAVLDAAGALIVVLDINGRIIRFNRTCERVTGYSFDEISDKSLWALLVPEEKPKVKAVFDELLKERLPNKGENYWLTKSGEKRLIAWSNTTLENKAGEVEYVIGIGLDITDVREAEEKLKLYRRIFTASIDGISIVDIEGKLVEGNPAQQRAHNQRRETRIGQHISRGLRREDLERIGKTLKGKKTFRGEVQIEGKSGEIYYIDLSIFPIYNDAGELINFIGIERDVTQRKLDQEALATRLRYEEGLAGCSQALLETKDVDEILPKALRHLLTATKANSVYIFENCDDPGHGLCMRHRYGVHNNGTMEIINDPQFQHIPYQQYFGEGCDCLADNKPFGGPLSDLPTDMQNIFREKGVLSVQMLPIWINKKWYGFIGFDDTKEEREWNDEEVRLLKTAAEMIGGFIARRQAVDALRSSEERFRMLVENSNNVIFSLNPHGDLTYLSPQFESYSGFLIQDFLGKPVGTILHEEDAPVFMEELTNAILKGNDKHVTYQGRVVDKNKELRWFVSNASAIRDDDGNVVEIIGVAHDITELKSVMDDLKEANQHLKDTQTQLIQSEKMAALGMLVAGIAHEINTPIGSVGSMHDTLVRAVSKLGQVLDSDCLKDTPQCEKARALLKIIDDANNVIKDGTERVTTIVKRLRSFARLDEAELKDGDIHEGLEDTLTLIHHEIKHNIKVNRNYGEVPPIPCYLGRLNQVFVNILINAKQAIKDKGEVTISTYQRDGKIHIEFSDTGVGIPKENLKKIFDPGFTTKGVGVGTGLGLSICYQIIQDHLGEIKVQSEVGKGTTFTIILPTNLDELLGIS